MSPLPDTTATIRDETSRHIAQLRRARTELREQVRLANQLIHEARRYIARIDAIEGRKNIPRE